MLTITPAVRNLLIITVLVFIVSTTLTELTSRFALYSVLSDRFRPYQFLTYIFLHANFGHLLGNMFGLFMFGPMLEQMWGSKRFVFFYLFTGIGAGILFTAIDYFEMSDIKTDVAAYMVEASPQNLVNFISSHAQDVTSEVKEFVSAYKNNPENEQLAAETKRLVNAIYQSKLGVPMIGASGAIFGILMAFGLLFPNTELFLMFIPVPIKAKYFVAFYGLYELYAGFRNSPSDNVAHFAHIGGMLFAYILLKYWGIQRNKFY